MYIGTMHGLGRRRLPGDVVMADVAGTIRDRRQIEEAHTNIFGNLNEHG